MLVEINGDGNDERSKHNFSGSTQRETITRRRKQNRREKSPWGKTPFMYHLRLPPSSAVCAIKA
jgi:hypothetical protein